MEAVCVFFWSANQGLQLCVCFWCPRLFTKKNNLLFIFSFSPAEPPVLLEHFWNTTKIYLFKKKRTQKKGEKEIKSCGNLDRGQSESDCLMSREGTGGWIGRWDRHWMSGLSAAVRNCPETSRVEGWVELAGGWSWWKPVSFLYDAEERKCRPNVDKFHFGQNWIWTFFIAFMNFPIAWYGQLFFGRHFDGRNRQ